MRKLLTLLLVTSCLIVRPCSAAKETRRNTEAKKTKTSLAKKVLTGVGIAATFFVIVYLLNKRHVGSKNNAQSLAENKIEEKIEEIKEITVIPAYKKEDRFKLKVDILKDTIKDIKKKIESMNNINSKMQRVIISGKEREDSQKLAEFIRSGQTDIPILLALRKTEKSPDEPYA